MLQLLIVLLNEWLLWKHLCWWPQWSSVIHLCSLWISCISKGCLFHFKADPDPVPCLSWSEGIWLWWAMRSHWLTGPTRDRQKTQLELLNIFVLISVLTMSLFYTGDSMLKIELLLFPPHGTLYHSSLLQIWQWGTGMQRGRKRSQASSEIGTESKKRKIHSCVLAVGHSPESPHVNKKLKLL